MKIFKRIYYPVMAALVVLMLVLGIVDARVGTSGGNAGEAYDYAKQISAYDHNSYNESDARTVRDYVFNTIKSSGVKNVNDPVSSFDKDDDGKDVAEYYTTNAGEKQPSLYRQKTTVWGDSQNGNDISVAREVDNVILAIPGQSENAVLLHVRTDSPAVGGGADSGVLGAMLKVAIDTAKNDSVPNNTVVFLFGDAGQEGDLGACAFLNQFVGFDNVVSNIKAVADFSVGGTGGTLMVYGNEKGSLGLIGKYARINGKAYSSSALSYFINRSDYSGNGTFGDYNTLNFTNRGGFERYATANDSAPDKTLVSQQVKAMQEFVKQFSSINLNKVTTKSAAVYFSYLDVMTVYYPTAVAFVIAGIILGLVIAIIILNIKNKTFSWGKALAGAAVQLVTVIATSLLALALYYLFALLLCGFGVVPFRALSSVKFAGTGTLLSAVMLAVTVAIFFYIILKRTFGVKAADVVRGNTLLFALVAFVLSFAAPAISYPFTCVALFSLTAMLMTVLFKNRFKAKFGTDIERLFLYVWSIVFVLPLLMPVLFVVQTLTPAVSIALILAVFVGLSGFIAPFADYLKPVIDKVFKKLPMRTVRYERVVTEKVEDRAKKGKFTEVTSKKVFKEKTPCRYLNRIGIITVSIIASVMVLLFSAFNTAFSSAAMDNYDYYDGIYDDSLLLVYEKNSVGAENVSLLVSDKSAYNYIRYAIKDLNWSDSKNAYVKSYNAKISDVIGATPSLDISGDTVKLTTVDTAMSQITFTLSNASSVTSVKAGDNEYKFDGLDKIIIRLPYGYETPEITITGSCTVSVEQHLYNTNNLLKDNDDDWAEVYNHYSAVKEVSEAFKGGIILKLVSSK